MGITRFSNLSIRTQLIVLSVLLTLPALGIIVYSGLKERSADYHHAVIESQRLADNLAAQQEILTNETKLLCTLLAKLPEIKNHQVDQVESILADIKRPQYLNIMVADAAGYVWASAIPVNKSHLAIDRRYFKSAQQSKLFSSGEFVIGKASQKPTIHMAYPLLNGDEFSGVIIVSFDLDVMNIILEFAQLSYDANYVFVDHNGIIVSRGKDPAALIGKPIPPDTLKMMEEGPDKETFKFLRRDGDNRITTYRKLWLPGEQKPYLYVRAGISMKEILAKSNIALATNVSILLLFVLFAFLTAFIIGKRSIVDRIAVLKSASQRLASGELDFRVSDQISGGELGSFAETFDAMAQQLEGREKSLQKANRELEAFVSTVSHDLRSPLTPIIGYADFLRESCRDRLDKQAIDCLAEISASGGRMMALMEDLLTLAQVGQVERPAEPFGAEEVVNEVVRAQAWQISKAGVPVDIGALPTLRVPKTLLAQIFDNLIGNAVRYASTEGSSIKVGGERSGDLVRFYVRDHGPGIPKEERSRIFEAFYRGATGKKSPGTGVGLATVQKIARLYGGRAWVEETEGGGSTFWVKLVDIPTAAENMEDTH